MYDPTTGGIRMAFHKKVLATTRYEAFEKLLPEMAALIAEKVTDSTIKYVSVFSGRVGYCPSENAERLAPFQIEVATGKRRKSRA
jgi:hypothetical protein